VKSAFLLDSRLPAVLEVRILTVTNKKYYKNTSSSKFNKIQGEKWERNYTYKGVFFAEKKLIMKLILPVEFFKSKLLFFLTFQQQKIVKTCLRMIKLIWLQFSFFLFGAS
jgi:hypothetical protein